MLYEEIPQEFKLKIKTYFDALCHSIQDTGKHLSVNGTIIPKSLKSQHNNLDLTSQLNLEVMTENFFLLDMFHQVCTESNVFYSIFWGDMIGYYREGGKLLWDDDIDLVIIGNKGAEFIHNLWNDSGKQHHLLRRQGSSFYYKNINISGYNVVIIKKVIGMRYHYKLKLNVDISQFIDVRGIDIIFLSNGNDFWNIDLSLLNNYEINDSTYPIVKYGPIDARILIRDPTTIILNKQYGHRWTEKIHPQLHSEFSPK